MADPLVERFSVLANSVDDSDWLDVRRRAGVEKRRRPFWVVIAVVLTVIAVLLATPAAGLRGRIVQLFEENEPAPTRVVRAFETFDLGVPANMRAPGVIAGQTRLVLRLAVPPDREAVLWVAPTKRGSFCKMVAVRQVGTGGGGGGGGCVSPEFPFSPGMAIPGPWSTSGEILRPPVLLYGSVQLEAAVALEVRYADEARVQVPLTWVSKPIDAAFFVYSIPRAHWAEGHRPSALVVLDAEGRTLVRDTRLVRFGWPTPLDPN
jgi:hypothetical protein